MENKELIDKYLKFKEECLEANIVFTQEIQFLFKLKVEEKNKPFG